MKISIGNPIPNPCHGCDKRCAGCATNCQPWQDYEAKRNILYEERIKQNEARARTEDYIARDKKRLRRQKNKWRRQ